MNIVVLCGGLSMERNVSITSGTLACKALRSLGHNAVLVDMFYGLEDYEGSIEQLFANLPEIKDAQVGSETPDLEKVRASRKWQSASKIGPRVLELCQAADVVFLALHGACGEDGRIQATLDLLGSTAQTGSGCTPRGSSQSSPNRWQPRRKLPRRCRGRRGRPSRSTSTAAPSRSACPRRC